MRFLIWSLFFGVMDLASDEPSAAADILGAGDMGELGQTMKSYLQPDVGTSCALMCNKYMNLGDSDTLIKQMACEEGCSKLGSFLHDDASEIVEDVASLDLYICYEGCGRKYANSPDLAETCNRGCDMYVTKWKEASQLQ
ncbi:hypothetical protein OTU49_003599 [Cherax quadricarinatus]|uniref:Uncharacterized protein n=1 Tax=Cherax quadricarinatus TaxID=27406 RepID=A0AAW0X637_CHEQU|nr:uncharacterized protein LOC128701311 [Cherax quadricarinatus]